VPVQTTVVGNTFTLDNTATTTGFYLIEVDANTLDMANGFTAMRVGVGNAVAQTLDISYRMGNLPRYSGEAIEFRDPTLD
jgi:hypothetical protein